MKTIQSLNSHLFKTTISLTSTTSPCNGLNNNPLEFVQQRANTNGACMNMYYYFRTLLLIIDPQAKFAYIVVK